MDMSLDLNPLDKLCTALENLFKQEVPQIAHSTQVTLTLSGEIRQKKIPPKKVTFIQLKWKN